MERRASETEKRRALLRLNLQRMAHHRTGDLLSAPAADTNDAVVGHWGM